MIEWVETKEISIFFDDIPHIKMRYILPSTPKGEIISIELYPFICTKTFKVAIFDKIKMKKYHFTISKGYCYDGCTIPRFLWSLIGLSKEDNKGLIASLLHDKITESSYLINKDRKLSTIIFRELCITGGMSIQKAYFISFFVDIYQKIFCSDNWN